MTFWYHHVANLRAVFLCLQQAGLKLKPTKCKLVCPKVEYLGYVVSEKGISTNPEKIHAVQEFPRPRDLQALQAFLGLVFYYRQFVPSFFKVAQPLFALTHKGTLGAKTVKLHSHT